MNKIDEIRKIALKSKLLYTKNQVEAAIDEMAFKIESVLSGSNPLCLTVMVGGMVVTGSLLRRLHFPLELDYIHATRYKGEIKASEMTWKAYPSASIKDRIVLLIDDIFDGGLTISAIKKYCLEQGASKVYVAVLINKIKEREEGVIDEVDFSALEIEDRFIYGYGMDYQEYLRNAPGIFAVPREYE